MQMHANDMNTSKVLIPVGLSKLGGALGFDEADLFVVTVAVTADFSLAFLPFPLLALVDVGEAC